VRATPAEISRAGAGGRGFFITASSFDRRDAFDPGWGVFDSEDPVSELIPFPSKRVPPEPVDCIVDLYDQNLRQAAIAIIDQAFATGGHVVVAKLTARLFVAIGATFGDSTLLEALEEMARKPQ
jgi:hypothetical protein